MPSVDAIYVARAKDTHGRAEPHWFYLHSRAVGPALLKLADSRGERERERETEKIQAPVVMDDRWRRNRFVGGMPADGRPSI